MGQPGPAHGADRRQPPVRRHAGAAQGPDRRAVAARPADRPDPGVGPRRTCCGAIRRASTSCSRRRASRWPRWSRSATSRRRSRCCAASTTSCVVDTPAVVNDINLSFLDASDTILEVVTYDSTTIHSTMVMADAFRMIGYPPTKVRYLVNRADSTGGFDPETLSRALGRVPEHTVSSGGALVVRANNEGIPFVLADPRRRSARTWRGSPPSWWGGCPPPPRGGSPAVVSDPRPIGVFDSGVGGLTVLREILRRTPHESTIYLGDNARAPYGVRSDDEVRRFSAEALDELASRDVKALVVACNTSTAVALRDLRARYDLPVLGVVRPGAAAAALATRNRRVGVIATPATVRSHAYFNAIKDENPAIEVYEHATPRFVPMVEAGILGGAELESVIAEDLAPLLGERDGAGEFVFPRPPSAKIDTLLLGCTHYPLIRPALADAVGDRVAIVDSATATASSLAELLSVNGLEMPGTTRGTAADAGLAGHERPARVVRGRGPRPADDGRRRPLPRHRDADVRRVVPGRGGGRARRRGGRLMAGRSGGRGPDPQRRGGIPEERAVAGRLRRRLRHRGGGHGRRPPDRALGPRGRPRRLGPGRGPRGRAPAPRARDADRRGAARGRGRLRGRDGAGRAGAGRPPGHGAARRGRARRRGRPHGLGPGEHRGVRAASSAGSRATCSSRCCRRAADSRRPP